MTYLRSLICFFSLSLTLACGDDGGDDDASGGSTADGGTGGGSTGGGSTGGGSTGAGGTGNSGSGGAASGGGSASGELCEPSDFTTPGWSLYPTAFDTCGDVGGIEDANGNAGFRNIDVASLKDSGSVGPGETFAFSANMDSGRGTFELWGATEKCGDAQELLDSFMLEEPGLICLEAAPQNGTYTHLIWVWRSVGEQLDTTICSSGTCPAR